jgi:photosynthetic reaction center cytochrome c subunit
MGDKAGQNSPEAVVNLSSLPNDPFTPFLLGNQNIRVAATTALPNGNRQSIKQTEWTYGLMTHASQALGVNCTYCHNTRSFQSWQDNPPQRAVAWYGIRMARSINKDYLEPLANVFPDYRKGALGDVAKANCATCHQGAYKPLYGAPMVRDFPELLAPAPATEAVAAAQ